MTPDIDWQSEVNTVEGEVESQLRRALAFSEYGNREPEQYHFDPEEG